MDDEYFVVFEAVHGRSPEYEHEDELLMILRGWLHFIKRQEELNRQQGNSLPFS
ncbi:hypothetical protein ACI2OX_06520 [Bacillus sp. N9]